MTDGAGGSALRGGRHKAGAWTYREAEAGIPREEAERNIYLERPFVNQPTVRDGIGDVPFHALAIAVDDRDPHALREHLAWYKDPDVQGPRPGRRPGDLSGRLGAGGAGRGGAAGGRPGLGQVRASISSSRVMVERPGTPSTAAFS